MSYLVLARKWRPRNFDELAGQEHVRRALMNALESGRVHHAFLFTGTRGVGKTTIARILAKSLNCETGVTARPCGRCSACTEIDEGRFVDLIEVDAASRTKVDDTRELLDNVQYSPARGRYKVYLIDEVHMLSTHSFNALLKTLEEPPPHVKFLLATTDPQKLPVTVLSRCLQFNLKRLTAALIIERLTRIVEAEGIDFDTESLRLIARAAEGSMRDALSLLDQVIAFGGGRLGAADTRAMLGTLDRSHVHSILQALFEGAAKAMLERVAELDERVPDYREVLADVASTLQRIALLQAVPDLGLDEDEDAEALHRLARVLDPADVQLAYQIALIGRRDLDLAPDPRAGFEMVLLRMLAFRPAAELAAAAAGGTPLRSPSATRPVSAAASGRAETSQARAGAAGDWHAIVAGLRLTGPLSQLAAHCTLERIDTDRVRLRLDRAGELFRSRAREERLAQALSEHFGRPLRIELDVVDEAVAVDTPARRRQLETADRLQAARTSIESDPNVRAMQEVFNAELVPDSIKPLG